MLSIITPVLDEEENVEPFCRSLCELFGEFEVIVVDGGSSDATVQRFLHAADGFPHRMSVLETRAGRGLQMNEGVRAATGTILLFLHIDCRIPCDAISAIDEAMTEPGVIGGGFRHSFMNSDLVLSANSRVGNLLARRRQIFLGDFGIFVRREIFDSIGGYDDLPFLEDAEFSKKARNYGRLVQLDRTILVSPRRYEAAGEVRLSALYAVALLLNAAGVRPWFLKRHIADKTR